MTPRGARPTLDRRAAGVLLHPTSLPGLLGSGDIGGAALRFVDWLASAGQRWWQMLPTTPVGPALTPYSSDSAFAGEPLLIDPSPLVRHGLLSAREVSAVRAGPADRVRIADVTRARTGLLRAAYERYRAARRHALRDATERFRHDHAAWIVDYALFKALKRAHRGAAWSRWPRELRLRRSAALAEARRMLADEIDYHVFVQTLFDAQWRELRSHAASRGVALLGDIPIFVTHDSADVWANAALFKLDRLGNPTVVSGCPPDAVFAGGQRWGHPHYDWSAHARRGFAWWIARVRSTLERFDAARIDHFLGFDQVYEIPARSRFTEGGRYVASPGDGLLTALRRAVPRMQLLAEDLGNRTASAERLRDRHKLPGMRVMQWAFGDGARYDQPHNLPRRCVAYTGTHDTPTLVGWLNAARRDRRRGRDGLTTMQRLLRYVGGRDDADLPWRIIRLLHQSPADVAIVPMQDLLMLDDAARMNTPATKRGNWVWRMMSFPTASLAARLRDFAEAFER